MKKNEFAEIKKMDIKAVAQKVKKMKSEIAGLVIDKNMNKMTNLKLIKNKRRDIAQILTVLKQKNLLKEMEEKNV